jgi:hypothetical protein
VTTVTEQIPGKVSMEKIITINDEMHSDCGLEIVKCGITLIKLEIRVPEVDEVLPHGIRGALVPGGPAGGR